MLSSLKAMIAFSLAHANFVQWLAYGFVLAAFIFIMLLAIYIGMKSLWQVGFLILVLDFGLFFYGIYLAHTTITQRLYPVQISNFSTKQLSYSNSLLVEFDIVNQGSKDLSVCQIYLGFYHQSPKSWLDSLYALRPFRTFFINITKDIAKSDSISVARSIKDFNVQTYAINKHVECY